MHEAGSRPAVLPAWFERQAAASPRAVAVSARGSAVSYGELNARANRLARRLVELGAGPEQLVVVAMARSAELLVALLAVLKAGAAYLPMDPDTPRRRVAAVVDAARPVLAVTTEAGRRAVDGLGVPAVVLDGPEPPGRPAGPPSPDPTDADRADADLTDADRAAPLRPHHPAYVIYTSGSTGAPKGVVVEHRALTAYLAHAVAHYPGTRGRAVLHSSTAYDMAVTTLFAPLVSGGCVEVCALDETSAAPDFLKVTPSHLALLAVLPDSALPTGELVVGGEQLLGEAVAAFRRRRPDVAVVNEYGPTEATVGCCVHVVPPGDSAPPGAVPIGHATADAELYVLDERLRPVADGEGELYIGGAQLARGYLSQPALTAERFVADPFGPPGSRMYRTGDRVRRRADGRLEYLGRLDGQVKIRGHRVELGEIESVLLRHPDVAQAAATVHDEHVVAYVVAAGGEACDEQRLREHVEEHLPPFMVPGAFVPLDALPLNANGKLDTGMLPVPRFGTGAPFRAPRTPEQKLLCELFARHSGTDAEVGVDDDFFALGGTSLGAAQVVSAARRHGLALALGDLMNNRTVARLVPEPA